MVIHCVWSKGNESVFVQVSAASSQQMKKSLRCIIEALQSPEYSSTYAAPSDLTSAVDQRYYNIIILRYWYYTIRYYCNMLLYIVAHYIIFFTCKWKLCIYFFQQDKLRMILGVCISVQYCHTTYRDTMLYQFFPPLLLLSYIGV